MPAKRYTKIDYILADKCVLIQDSNKMIDDLINVLNTVVDNLKIKKEADCNFEKFSNSKLIVILISKNYSQSFKKLFESLIKHQNGIKKKIFLVKMDEEVEIDVKLEDCYDIYKHKNENNFDGYVTRRLLANLAEFASHFHRYEYKVSNHVFMCNIEDSHTHHHIRALCDILKDRECSIISRASMTDDNEIKDAIKISKIIIFVLTRSYYKSKEFALLLDDAKKQEKTLVFLLAEEIHLNRNETARSENDLVDLNKFNVIPIFKNYNSSQSIWKGEFFYRICNFIFSSVDCNTSEVIEMDSILNDKNINNNLSFRFKRSLRERSLKKVDFVFELSGKNQIVIVIGHRFVVYNADRFTYVHQRTLTELTDDCIIQGIHYNAENGYIYCVSQFVLFLLNIKLEIVEIHDSLYPMLKMVMRVREVEFKSFAYDQVNSAIYLFNSPTNQIINVTRGYRRECIREGGGETATSTASAVKSLHLFNGYIYVCMKTRVLVYDLDLKYQTTFGESILKRADHIIMDNKAQNCLYILDSGDRCLKMFNFTYKYIGAIRVRVKLNWKDSCKGVIVNGNLILHDRKQIFIQQMDNRQSNTSFSGGFYVCKINPFNHHVCRNPYELPCGNIACLKCIYYNYDLTANKFICNFENCKIEHGLNGEIKELFITDDSVLAICCNQIEYKEKLPDLTDYLNEKKKSFENYFKYIQEEIDIRYESIRIQIDELEKKALKSVDSIQQKLFEKIAATGEPSAKRPKYSNNKSTTNSIIKNIPCKSFSYIKKLHVGDLVNDFVYFDDTAKDIVSSDE